MLMFSKNVPYIAQAGLLLSLGADSHAKKLINDALAEMTDGICEFAQGYIHTLRDVEDYIDTQPEATPQEVAGQCWRNSKYDPPTEADADRLGRIIVWGAAVKHVDITYWENAIFHPVDVPFWMPLPVAPEEKAE